MALSTDEFGDELKKRGFDFYCGVPCSFLNNLINYAINDANFIMCANEGDAVATASGANLAGKKSIVLMQNSGLSNAVSPLTSLNYPFRLPVLGFVSLRGETGLNDEPQHELLGTITDKLLELMAIEWAYLSDDIETARQQISDADQILSDNKSFFFIVRKGTFNNVELKEKPFNIVKNEVCCVKCKDDQNPTRLQILECLSISKNADTLLLATTGKTGRELYEIEDVPNNFYMVGSMGCISSIALGIALNSNNNVIAIDGDGALIMRMGNLATNAYYAPPNLLHVLIDNNMHDSTGGQFTVSRNMDFVSLAASTGYKRSLHIHSLEELKQAIKEWRENPALTFLNINARAGTKENLGRPKVTPFEVKQRVTKFINE